MNYHNILNVEKDITITTKTNLTDAEKQIGNAIIPPSYLQFASEMGFGLLMGFFLTYIPFGKNNQICDSLENRNSYWKNILNRYVNDTEKPLSIFENPENVALIKHAEPFLKSENGEIVFWDTRKQIKGEYSIYLVDFPAGIYYVADNFKNFIQVLANEDTYKKVLKFYETPLQATFKPFATIG